MNDNMSPADVAAVVGNTDRNIGYAYPVFPYGNGGGFGNSGYGSDWLWIILLLALFGGFGNNGNGGFGGGFNNDYAWLSNGQKEIMQNTNDGFNTLHLSNQLEGVRDGIYGLSNQLCNCCSDMQSAVANGFYNAEISANNRQMADMQQNFALSTQVANASADNRLGIAGLNSTIISENCADREALSNGIRDIIANQTASTQRILDQLCNDKIDAKNEKILDLQRQLDMADLKASQIAQNSFIAQGFADEVDQLYNRLSNCPVPSTPVYGRTPIFTCSNNNGCGCGNTFGSTLV
jgi:hypothetical protein